MQTSSNSKSTRAPKPAATVTYLLILGLLTRVVTDTTFQLFFPFLPIMAAGLGISAVVMGRLLTLRSLMGLVSPLFGVLADRRGYPLTLSITLLLGSVGLFLIATSQLLWQAMVGMALLGMGVFSFTPSLQAYLGAMLPFENRSRGLSILEYGWALAGIFGLLLVGILIDWQSWRAPLVVLGVLLFITAIIFYRLPPAQTTTTEAVAKPATPPLLKERIRNFLYFGNNNRSAWASIVSGGLLAFGALHLYTSYGTWLQREYGLGASEIGRIALIIGIFDLGGSMLISFFGDRVGKRNTLLIGIAMSIVTFALLPTLNSDLQTAIIGLLLTRLSFEIAFVGHITHATEQAPERRGRYMTVGAAFSLICTSFTGLTSPTAYENWGLAGLSYVGLPFFIISMIIILTMVNERGMPESVPAR